MPRRLAALSSAQRWQNASAMYGGNFDLQLVEAARTGNRVAVRAVVVRATRVIDKVCRRLSRGQRHRYGLNVNDLRQEVLEFLFQDRGRVLAKFDPQRGSFDAFLWKIASNRVITVLRNRGSSGGKEIPSLELPEQPSADDADSGIFLQQVIEALRRTLTELLWKTFELVFVDGKSVLEAARELNTSPSVIHLRIHKIRKVAREALEA
jgi:RNA polymerase sigma factor (sigma-70 family)